MFKQIPIYRAFKEFDLAPEWVTRLQKAPQMWCFFFFCGLLPRRNPNRAVASCIKKQLCFFGAGSHSRLQGANTAFAWGYPCHSTKAYELEQTCRTLADSCKMHSSLQNEADSRTCLPLGLLLCSILCGLTKSFRISPRRQYTAYTVCTKTKGHPLWVSFLFCRTVLSSNTVHIQASFLFCIFFEFYVFIV